MNDAQLTQALNQIAEKDMPEMDKLNAIRSRIDTRKIVYRRRRKLLIAAALLLLSLLGAAVGYALYQNSLDPGLQAVEDAGMITPLGLSETVDGLTFTVTQGYADENRVALWYTLSGSDIPEAERLFINTGLFHPEDDQWFGTGAQSGYPIESDDPDVIAGILTFDHLEPIPADGLYQLRLKSSVQQFPDSTASDALPETLADFSFTFELPAEKAIRLEPNQSVTANDVEMTLESLRISPSQTAISLCFDMPSPQDWQPNVALSIDGQAGLYSGGGTQGGKDWTLDSPRRCLDINFLVPYAQGAKTLILDVDRLQTSVPEPTADVLERATQRLAEQGISVKFNVVDHGMGWDVLDAPDDLSEVEINTRIWDSMREQYAGSWHFEVELP